VLEEILDFGHAPIFEDADTFPCIIVVRPRSAASEGGAEDGAEAAPQMAVDTTEPPLVSVCPVPRDRSTELSLEHYVHEHAYPVAWSRYDAGPWSLESPEVETLMGRLRERGVPLAEFVGCKPYRGVFTGLNEAFLIDEGTRTHLIREDPACAEIIKPYLRGQDIGRWVSVWQGLWMIFTRRGIDIDSYPSIRAHLEDFRERLEPRPADWDAKADGAWPGREPGRYAWYEIQDSVDYWRLFDRPKIIHTDIAWRPQLAFSESPTNFLNTCYVWPTADLYVLGVLNSPLMWAYLWRNAQDGKDEALRLFGTFMTSPPIAEPIPEIRAEVEEKVAALLARTTETRNQTHELLNWLRHDFAVEKPGQQLEDVVCLTRDAFAAEVRKRRPKGAPRLSPAAIGELTDTHASYAGPMQQGAAEIRALERRLSDLVNQVYRLSDEDIALIRRTAPPRMPGY
jgi:hypothetical protein